MAEILHDIPDSAKVKQRSRLLEALMEHLRLTTGDIRDFLGIYHPAGRVRELRARGYEIKTVMGWFPDSDGNLHRQAQYLLLQKESGHV